MESKDPLLIVTEIEASKIVVYDAIKEVLAVDGYDLDQEMSNYLTEQGFKLKPNSLAIAVLITIVVVIVIAVNLTYEYTKTQGSGKNSSSAIATNSDLTSETLAAQIALIN
jgi:cell division protein ZapA (FtsZ GTPase activity inhibitor)